MYLPNLICDKRASRIRLSVVVSEMLVVLQLHEIPRLTDFYVNGYGISMVRSGQEFWFAESPDIDDLDEFLYVLCTDMPMPCLGTQVCKSYEELVESRQALISALEKREQCATYRS